MNDIAEPSRMDALRERIEAKAEIDRLRARVAELEAAKDIPELDGTDFAHPAWWRGHDHTTISFVAAVNRILDGGDDGKGVAREPWQALRDRLRGLVQGAAKGGA